MITHVVLLQPKSQTTPNEIRQILQQVQELQQHVPGIIDIQTGENVSTNHHGYTYGFLMHFVDRDALKAYAPHPAHRVVSDVLVRACDNIIDFDLPQDIPGR